MLNVVRLNVVAPFCKHSQNKIFFADFFAEKSLGQEIICFDESFCLGTSGQDKVLESGTCTIKLFVVVIYGFW